MIVVQDLYDGMESEDTKAFKDTENSPQTQYTLYRVVQ